MPTMARLLIYEGKQDWLEHVLRRSLPNGETVYSDNERRFAGKITALTLGGESFILLTAEAKGGA